MYMGGALSQAVRNVDLEFILELAHLGLFRLQKNVAQKDEKLKSRCMHNAFILRTTRESADFKGDRDRRRN